MVKIVTFDWWFTIARPPLNDKEYQPWAKRLRVDGMLGILQKAGIEVPRERLSEGYDLFTDHIAKVWDRNADLTGEDQISLILRYAGVKKVADRGLLSKLGEPFRQVLFELPPILNDGIAGCLRQLKSEGYRIGVISNTGRTWGRYLREIQKHFGIFQFFDVLTFSDEMGVRKPESAIFTKTLEKFATSPESAVHIGDDATADVAGAKAVGMKAVWYNNGEWPEMKCDGEDAEIDHFSKLPAIVRRL